MVVSTASIFDLYNKELIELETSNIAPLEEKLTSKTAVGCSGTSDLSLYDYLKNIYLKSSRWTLDKIYPILSWVADYYFIIIPLLKGLGYFVAYMGTSSAITGVVKLSFYNYLGVELPTNRYSMFFINFITYIIVRTAIYFVHEYSKPSENDGNGIYRKIKSFIHYTSKIYGAAQDVGFILQIFFNIMPFIALFFNNFGNQNAITFANLFAPNIMASGQVVIQGVRNESWPEFWRVLSDAFTFGLSDAFLDMLGLNNVAYRFIIGTILTPTSGINSFLYRQYSNLTGFGIYGIVSVALPLAGIDITSRFMDIGRLGEHFQTMRRKIQVFLNEGYRRIGNYS